MTKYNTIDQFGPIRTAIENNAVLVSMNMNAKPSASERRFKHVQWQIKFHEEAIGIEEGKLYQRAGHLCLANSHFRYWSGKEVLRDGSRTLPQYLHTSKNRTFTKQQQSHRPAIGEL